MIISSQNRRQKVLNRGIYVGAGGLDTLIIDTYSTDKYCFIFQFGGLEALLGRAKTTKAPVATGLFQAWDPCISTCHRIPTSRNATVLWGTLCCCVTLRCVVRLRLIVSWPSKIFLVRHYFMQISLSKMSHLNLNSLARKLGPCISLRLHLGSCCLQCMTSFLIKLIDFIVYFI